MNKRGQGIFGLSYGAIFSIILIIAIIGVAIFAINHFLNLNNCTQIGLAFDKLQDEVNKAWTSGIYVDTYEIDLPQEGFFKSGIDNVCFGALSLPPEAAAVTIKANIEDFDPDAQGNFFFNPPENACDGDFADFNLEHFETSSGSFFCVKVQNGKAEIRLDKQSTDSSVKISAA